MENTIENFPIFSGGAITLIHYHVPWNSVILCFWKLSKFSLWKQCHSPQEKKKALGCKLLCQELTILGHTDEHRYRTGRGGGAETQPWRRHWWMTLDPTECNISQGWECIINWNPCLVPPCRPLYNCISTLKTIFSRIRNEESIFKMWSKKTYFIYMWLYCNGHTREALNRYTHYHVQSTK